MDQYELTGRMVFGANDVNDAFRKLSDHFHALASGKTSNLPEPGTEVKVKRVGALTPTVRLKSTIPPPPRMPEDILDSGDDQ